MSTATLTERYLHAALRTAPDDQRAVLRRELAERIGDDVDARIEAGATPEEAERRALEELGDPDLLIAGYLDRPQRLLGPAVFGTWKKLLRTLLIIVVPIVAVAFPLAQTLAQQPLGEIIRSTVAVLIGLVVHLTFWTTLVFAVLDRNTRGEQLTAWSLDSLPDVVQRPVREVRADAIANLVFIAVMAAAIALHPWFLERIAGERLEVFDAGTWAWLPWVLGAVLALEAAFWVVMLRRQRWTYASAAIVGLLSAAFAAPIAWAFFTGVLLDPSVLVAAGWQDAPEQLGPGGATAIVGAFGSVIIAAIWPVDAAVKAYKARQRERLGQS